ncbi:Mu transposase, C-terminal [Actinomadura madurae]|uniref:Mu transposase, C-terminal n=1 Tax=Actinomadura madurae TaxID=1993 RepID=A0A1I5JTY5_9ACTN|nr:Mu transposase C-terminal domain-containing protein [Actinomadura madurae]SFO76237.1 Mu transposase, C-terminal [Actinomadura madurae]
MSVSRPVSLRIGDQVRMDGQPHTVTGVAGPLVHLADPHGAVRSVPVAVMQASPGFKVLTRRTATPLSSQVLSGLSDEAAEFAMWWEQHLLEVITGTHPEAPAGASPRAEYDPAVRSMAEREQAKAEELTAAGHEGVSVHTIRRKRLRYQAQGLVGVLDKRAGRRTSIAGRSDQRVIAAIQQAIAEKENASSRTGSYYFWRVEQILTEQHGEDTVVMPSRATFYRLFDRLTTGRHITGSARTRRSLANRPEEKFGEMVAVRPGQVMEIDSTPLDVLVLLDKGVVGRVELTGMVDLATRSLTAVALSPTTKSVDASLLLARTLTPELMRPGWPDALRMSRSVLPYRHMVDLDERLELAAARPVIVPETIVCDHGKAFFSRNFRSSCAALGINFQPAHKDTPTDKPHIERTIESVGTLFCQFVSGYTGSSVERRGRRVEDEPLWSIHEMQGLLEEWIVAAWQNRPHDGLRDPSAPGRAFTPNEKYASLVQAAGYVFAALSPDDYIELLPATWRGINAYGVKIRHRKYDSEELQPFRRQDSGMQTNKGLWEIRYDPYDVSRIWVRNHWHGGWITVPWTHLDTAVAPFGELAWDHSRKELGQSATESEITQAVNDLLTRAGEGPDASLSRPSRQDRRVVAKTKVKAAPAASRSPVDDAGKPGPETSEPDLHIAGDDAEDAAEVIPLPVFDARKEAEKWW